MAQVALQDSRASTWDGAAFNTTITTAPGLAGEHQLIVMTHFSGTVAAPELSGWQKGGTVTLGSNSFTAYKRVLTADVTSGGVQASFAQAVEGEAWCGSFNGAIGTITPFNVLEYTATARPIGAVTAQAANALQLFAGATDAYPRQADPSTGWTESSDRAQYAGAGGLALHVMHRPIGAGASGASSYDIRLTDIDGGTGGTGAGTRTMALNIAIEEIEQTNVATFDVLAEFPSIAVTVTPDRNTVTDNETASINANVVGSDQGVTYSIVQGVGTVTAQGVVTPTEPGTITVRAASVEAPSVFADAVIDVLPVVPTINPVAASVSPAALSGTAEPNATVQLQIYGNTITTSANGSGQWATNVALPPGDYELLATQTKNGKTSGSAGPVAVQVLDDDVGVTLDPPVMYAIASGEGDITIAGTGAVGATVRLRLNGALLPSMATVDSNGNWSVLLSLPVGGYSVVAYQVKDLTTSNVTEPKLFNVYIPVAPPAPTEWGARHNEMTTDKRGDLPKPPVTADESLGVGSVKTPFRTPKAWPKKGIHNKE